MKSSHLIICLICSLLLLAKSSESQGIKDAYLSAASIYDTRAANAPCDVKKNFFKRLADYNRCLAKKLETGQNVECTEPSLEEPGCGQSSSRGKTNTDSKTKETTTLPTSQNNNSKPYKGSQDAETYQRNISQYKALAANETCPQKKDYYNYMVQMFECQLNNVNSGGKTPCKGPIQEPVCQTRLSPTENGNLKEIVAESSNSVNNSGQSNMTTQNVINTLNILTDSNANQKAVYDQMDVLIGNSVGTTNLMATFMDVLDGKVKAKSAIGNLENSYKNLSYNFKTKYQIDYDEYISSIIIGNYEKWKSLYKTDIDINLILIHNFPQKFSDLALGNVAVVASYYGNEEFLKKLFKDFKNIQLNYKRSPISCEALQIAIRGGYIDVVKVLLENGAGNDPGYTGYASFAKDFGQPVIARMISEAHKDKKRFISEPVIWKNVISDDKNIKFLVKKSREANDWNHLNVDTTIKQKLANNSVQPQVETTLSLADELKKWKDLLDNGTITKDEFEKMKKKLLEKQ